MYASATFGSSAMVRDNIVMQGFNVLTRTIKDTNCANTEKYEVKEIENKHNKPSCKDKEFKNLITYVLKKSYSIVAVSEIGDDVVEKS